MKSQRANCLATDEVKLPAGESILSFKPALGGMDLEHRRVISTGIRAR